MEVGPLPGEAGLAGGVGVEEIAGGRTADLPALILRGEGDPGRSNDVKSSERTEIDRLGVEAIDDSMGIEAECGGHVQPRACC